MKHPPLENSCDITGWRMVPKMIWLGQLSRMIWTSLCRRRDSVKNLASAANGSGVSAPSASRLNVGHWGEGKHTWKHLYSHLSLAVLHALRNGIKYLQSLLPQKHTFYQLQFPTVNRCIWKCFCAQSFDIICLFSVYYCYPLLTDVTLLYTLSVFSVECGKPPDRYKHKKQTGLWTSRQKTPWNGCNIFKWEMKKD